MGTKKESIGGSLSSAQGFIGTITKEKASFENDRVVSPLLQGFLKEVLRVSATIFLLETRREIGTLTKEKLSYGLSFVSKKEVLRKGALTNIKFNRLFKGAIVCFCFQGDDFCLLQPRG